jgi:hypothetical protein
MLGTTNFTTRETARKKENMGMFEVRLLSLSPEQNAGLALLAKHKQRSQKLLISQAVDEFLQRELPNTNPDKSSERIVRAPLFR